MILMVGIVLPLRAYRLFIVVNFISGLTQRTKINNEVALSETREKGKGKKFA